MKFNLQMPDNLPELVLEPFVLGAQGDELYVQLMIQNQKTINVSEDI